MARREACKPPRRLELPAGQGRAMLDATPLVEAVLSWRGPLAFLRWRDEAGRRGRLSWWPDTLPPAQRRVLKLWSPDGPGMAP
jgi:toxin CptA